MTNPSFSISRIEKDIQWLIQDLGPRPAHSSNARLAALGIRDRLKEAGWDPKVAQLANNIVACKGNGQVLFLAHSDSVASSPGAVDNAVGVATLLELARATKAENLCVGFPAAEEIGLVGSRHMAAITEEWHPDSKKLALVISLDLTGKGQLSVTGLSTSWDASSLRWIASKGDIQSQYGYQVVSRILPDYERSDHASFASKGILTAQLLGSNEDGVFVDYHQADDTQYETQHIVELIQTLETIAISEPPQQEASWKSGLLLNDIVLPFWIIWPVCIGAVVMGLRTFSTPKQHCLNLLKMLGVWILWGALSNIPLWMMLLPSSIEETNAETITGIPANGWWSWANIYLPLLLIFLLVLQTLLTRKKSDIWSGSSSFWGGIFTLFMLIIDPLLAFPMAIATLLSRVHPFLLALGGAYWVSGGVLRQISFWGILPPFFWFLPALFLLPAIFVRK